MKDQLRNWGGMGESLQNGRGTLRGKLLAIGLACMFLYLFVVGPHPFLGIGAVLLASIIWVLFARADEPLILLYILLFQWLEVSVGIFYANFHNVPIYELSLAVENREWATALLLIGLFAQVIGIRMAMGSARNQDRVHLEEQLRLMSQESLFRIYLYVLLVSVAARLAAGLIPPLSQPLIALAYMKWAAFLLFTIASFNRSDASRALWLGVFLFELLFAIGDYFSSFKFVFVFTFLGIASSRIGAANRGKAGLVAIIAAAIFFGAVWTAIKVDYRQFVSGGEQAQVVTVPYGERVGRLFELVGDLTAADLGNGFDQLARRVAYVEFFADVLGNVPDYIPHTGGELWWDAIRRPFMPRLFFPDKDVLDESALTSTYLMREVAGFGEGTQISIGYFSEAYIDFGPYGMVVVMLLWGLVQGWVYQWMVRGRRSRGLLGIGLASATFVMACGSIGISAAKLVGGFVTILLIVWLLLKFMPNHWLLVLNGKSLGDRGAFRRGESKG